MIYIPERIQKIVGNEKYRKNAVGMSGSAVLEYDSYVLKIQPHTPETDNERDMVSWLGGRLPVPEIAAYQVEDGRAYTLMTRIKGDMLCAEEYLRNPAGLLSLAAEGLKLLWSIDVKDCPCRVSRLQERLKAARRNVENGMVDMDNVEPDTFGANGFAGPEELLEWLEQNQPREDIVLTHGDFCLPNIFAGQGHVTGFIDLGKMGPADRWQDIAIAMRSLEHNLSGKYHNGIPFGSFEPRRFLEELGVEPDEKKNRYYMLLDELF